MDSNDRQAIETLFQRLSAVEGQAAPRDAQSETFIRDKIARQPAAPYYMAQTIVMQEQALNAAQARIEELEQNAAQPSSGGLFGGLFGGAPSRGRGSVPNVSAARRSDYDQGSPWQRGAAGGGGGFLAGAAQTAMGVAGGVLLGNAIAGMWGGDEAQASEPDAQDDAGTDDAGADDADFDAGDMEL